nr:14294_t:CDS:2 [Entrophospora candida]
MLTLSNKLLSIIPHQRVNYGQNLSVDEVNSGCLTTTTDMLESDTDCL